MAQLRRLQHLAAADRHSPQVYLPGHYYSPIPDQRQVEADQERIFASLPREVPGIDLREEAQLELLDEFAGYYPDIPWKYEPAPGLRYNFDNEWYGYSDAIFLYSMIRHARPAQIVEAGSGFSSAVMLDTNERFFGGSIHCTFIDPYPDRLLSILAPQERPTVDLIRDRVERLDLDVYQGLKAGDIVFIDSSHVGKIGSDVNHFLFTVFPVLARGVYIHIHDVFYPFEYPRGWVMRGWNEDYLLRAFLCFNDKFRIVAFNTFLEHFHEDWFQENMPMCLLNTGGSLWLQKQ